MSERYVGRVCWKGMLEGCVGRVVVFHGYVGRVGQKGMSEGLLGGYVGRDQNL